MRRIDTLIHQVALAEGTVDALQAQAEGANQTLKEIQPCEIQSQSHFPISRSGHMGALPLW